MEARLLFLGNTGPETANLRKTWLITNGSGTPITHAQVPAPPPALTTTESTRRDLIEDLTVAITKPAWAVTEPGWSNWHIHHVDVIEYGVCRGEFVPLCSAIIVKNRVTGDVQVPQAKEKAIPQD